MRELTAERLASALVEATRSGRQTDRAKALGEQIRKEDGVSNAIAVLFRHLDYAKGLIKTDTRLPPAAEHVSRQPDRENTPLRTLPEGGSHTQASQITASTTSSSGDLIGVVHAQRRSRTSAEGGSYDGVASDIHSTQTSDAEWSVVSDADDLGASVERRRGK